jgi:hypothetical protein
LVLVPLVVVVFCLGLSPTAAISCCQPAFSTSASLANFF